ncbi:hypothetical protein Pyrfu_0018 [Pyrolobus fumarii 1A]|uniref:Uncharacterized protein n=1 Tax=Pyrolobus fumarii (strain DSM 11204 / 1A) TaxID=694429 RepID=G0EDQ3_PYRF1|nr:hypothetical protein [Pyrolobus fumarii]AEM37890.1 hypothetical protein Pyrfu_0018 [Pyrolobus fumarii 1A]
MVRAVLTGIVMAFVYAGVGIAPLVYTYLTARRARREYEREIEEAVSEPIVPVHVVVIVKEDDVEARLVNAATASSMDELVANSLVEMHSDDNAEGETSTEEGGILVPLATIGPQLEGVKAPMATSVQGVQEYV